MFARMSTSLISQILWTNQQTKPEESPSLVLTLHSRAMIWAGCAAASAAIAYYLEWSAIWTFVFTITLAYLPTYLDGSQCDPSNTRVNPAYGDHPVWRWVWTWVLGLPLSESRWKAEDFSDPSARYIFGSHPHGVMSAHHIGSMMCRAVSVPGKAFADLSPMDTRRDLGASVLFRIPLLRDWALRGGAVDAGRTTAARTLKAGYSCGILVGGEQEQYFRRQASIWRSSMHAKATSS